MKTTASSGPRNAPTNDYLGKRKFLVVLGYGLSAITESVFPLAASVVWVFAARFTDRIGKGIRGAPRDALVADITPRSCVARRTGCANRLIPSPQRCPPESRSSPCWVPKTETRNTGRRLWTSSEEVSMNKAARPSAQMPGGKLRRVDCIATGVSLRVSRS